MRLTVQTKDLITIITITIGYDYSYSVVVHSHFLGLLLLGELGHSLLHFLFGLLQLLDLLFEVPLRRNKNKQIKGTLNQPQGK